MAPRSRARKPRVPRLAFSSIFVSVCQCSPYSRHAARLLNPSTRTRLGFSLHCSMSVYTRVALAAWPLRRDPAGALQGALIQDHPAEPYIVAASRPGRPGRCIFQPPFTGRREIKYSFIGAWS